MKLKKQSRLKGALKQAVTGSSYNPVGEYSLITLFGCHACRFVGTKTCPTGIKYGEKHSNGLCKFHIDYLKGELVKCGTMVRLIQQEELFKLKMISDGFLVKWAEEGDLSEEFKHISKLIVTLTDKMRRQDEGIKIQGELTVAHEDFKLMVEAEAKKIEERNNRTRQAEFTEKIPDN